MSKPKQSVTLAQAFKEFIWPRRKVVFMGLILIIISRLAGLVLPGASKYLMDDVIVKKDLNMLKILLLVVAGSIVVDVICSFLLTKLLSVQAQRLIAQLRIKVQKKILSRHLYSYKIHDKKK